MKSAEPVTRIVSNTHFSRFVSAGNTKRRIAYTRNGKEIAVPPQRAIDIIAEKPLVRSRP